MVYLELGDEDAWQLWIIARRRIPESSDFFLRKDELIPLDVPVVQEKPLQLRVSPGPLPEHQIIPFIPT